MVVTMGQQYNVGEKATVILYYLRRFQRTIQAFSEPSQKKHSIERSSERNKVSRSDPRHPILNTNEITRVWGDTTPPTLSTRIFRDLRTPAANIGYICAC